MSNEATSPGHALRKVRTRNRLTQQQFATALGVSTRTVTKWEQGHVISRLGYSAIERWAESQGVELPPELAGGKAA